MFGYVVTNSKIMSEEDNLTYSAYYCGLCHALKENFGQISRMSLNYDLTFLALFLNSVYDEPLNEKTSSCPVHPIKKHKYFENDIFSYCADMNVAITYYKLKDDWNDDKSVPSYLFSKIIEKKVKETERKYPRQINAITECLFELSGIEKDNILIPDIPADCFGRLMGELFVIYDDEKSVSLRDFGYNLGKFIYISDACDDLKKDIKKQRYNPLITTDTKDFKNILTLLLSDCTEIYQKLDIKKNKSILDNILYSGIWTKYELKNNKRRKEKNDK